MNGEKTAVHILIDAGLSYLSSTLFHDSIALSPEPDRIPIFLI